MSTRFPAIYLLLILFLVGLHAILVQIGVSPYLKGELADTDAYMRLLRVEDLTADFHGWFDSSVVRMNAPFGDTLNWTRPLDVLIVAGALPLVAYAGLNWHDAIYQAGSFLPPLLHILMGLVLAWAAAPLLSRGQRPLVMLLATLLPVMIGYNLVARPDQQTLLLIALILMLGWATRGLQPQRHPLRTGLYAGLWAGFALWVTVEAQFFLIGLTAILALYWLETGEKRVLELLEGVALGFLLMVAAGVLAERGGQWAELRELDRISLSHLLGAIVNVALWGFLATTASHAKPMGRLVLTVFWGAVAFLGVQFFAPELLRGPAGDIDPVVLQQFFLKIREMRPLWPVNAESTGLMFFWLGVPLAALPLWLLARPRPLGPWLPFAGLTALFTLAALIHARFAQVAAPLGCVLLVHAAGALTARWSGRRGVYAQTLFLLLPVLGSFFSLALIPEGQAEPDCRVPAIASELRNLKPGVVLAPLNAGPELLYFTEHEAVGGPYHRNMRGILDTLSFFGTASDDEAQSVLRRRGVAYVLACPGTQARPAGRRGQALAEGRYPDWLVPLDLPQKQDFRLYRVK